MGPDQLGKSRRRLRGGVGIEGAHVATEGLGVRPASVNGILCFEYEFSGLLSGACSRRRHRLHDKA